MLTYHYIIFYVNQLVLVYQTRWWMENKEANVPGYEIPIHQKYCSEYYQYVTP